MKIGLDCPILLHAPKEIQMSAEKFNHLSLIGISSFFCNYPAAIEKKDDCYKISMCEGRERSYYKSPRFKDIKWYMCQEAEIVWCIIPIDNPLIEVINKKFSHLILK